ncbi:hypothetical protein MU582_06010 [Nocardioidaceae bacterium SCSIO 66511]|nr:hypothetical protein MU582_06010 [Nocardioidaceae bacterium SCSIO 66511]
MAKDEQSTDRREIERLRTRVERLEGHRRTAEAYAGYSRLYPALGVAIVVASFLPLYDDVADEESGMSWSYGSVWELLSQDNSGASMFGLLMMLGLAWMLGRTAFVPVTENIAMLITMAVLGVLLAIMVIAKPAMPDVKPDIGYGGQAGIALVLLTAAVALIHAWQIFSEQRRSRV